MTGFEARHGLRYTAETVRFLRRRRPDLDFVWLMGADNLKAFHQWGDWRGIFEMIPIAVIDRPGSEYAEINARASQAYGAFRADENDASTFTRSGAPAWIFLHGPLNDLSSTQLRHRKSTQ